MELQKCEPVAGDNKYNGESENCQEYCNGNEDEIHLNYDGASDESFNNTTKSSEGKININCNESASDNDEEIRLDYDGVSDDNCNDTRNSNELDTSLNPDGNYQETSTVNKDDFHLNWNEEKQLTCMKNEQKENCLDLKEGNEKKEKRNSNKELNFQGKDGSDEERHGRKIQKDKQTLQSDQQRLQREAQFSIPYHKPKKYTIQEFLSRRTIMKPVKLKENFQGKTLAKTTNLKMTKEELEIFSKLMEERAKEASEFFKAENLENSIETEKGKEKIQESNDVNHSKVIETKNTKECEKNFSNVVITEVLELPKLDLSTEINLKEIVQQSLSPQAKTLFTVETNNGHDFLKTSPVLNRNIDITIDLVSNERETSKPLNRADSLLERLMKTNNCRKPNINDDVGLLSPKCPTKSFIENTEPPFSKKPGETLLQLKDNLKTLIMKKRKEEMLKKQEENNDKKNLEFEDNADSDELNEIDDEELEDEVEFTCSENSDSESDSTLENELNDTHYSIEAGQKLPTQTELDIDIEGQMRLSFDEPDDLYTHGTPAISQIPATQISNREDEADQLIDLCSGTFETQTTKVPKDEKSTSNKISSSDEEISPFSSNRKPRIKKFTKKVRKSKMKLGFSDDEEDVDDGERDKNTKSFMSDKSEGNSEANDNEILADDDQVATYIDYDSEENEITVEMTKQDCLKRAENFVEKEAELSDSEWGSADEDEKNLDQYDIELGDEDEFDKEEVRAQLEKIHARKMLDEDIRQVNKLQEILFEDEEDESAKRQRKFRWKNLDTAFNLEMSQNQLTDAKPEDGSDDENEHLWRKIRFEREQAVQNYPLNENSLEANSLVTTPNAISDIKNVTIVTLSTKTKISGSEKKEKSPFLISKELVIRENAKSRSSFLQRNKNALTKTICSVKNGSSDVNISDDKIGVKSINPSKFVFTTLSLEEHETLKRKADDASSGFEVKISKRLKSETKKSEYLIDKLL